MAKWKTAKLIKEPGSQTVVLPEGMEIIGSRVSVGRIGKRVFLRPIRLKAHKAKPPAKGAQGRKSQ
jgi:virulence-associated protein VagC